MSRGDSMKKKVCAECGKEIEDTYLTILDNFIQIKYFDNEKDNVFCCQECLDKSN